jgi:dUTP pyrophosphatase
VVQLLDNFFLKSYNNSKKKEFVLINVYWKLLSKDAITPTQAHFNEDAGWDLYASSEVVIPANASAKVGTGVAAQAEFLEPRFSDNFTINSFVKGRSGLAFKAGITAFEGTIDQGYTNEIGILLFNNFLDDYVIRKGDKIAQLVFTATPKVANVKIVEEFKEKTNRGLNGFGSSGV